MLLFSNILLLVNTSRRKIKIFNIRVSSVIWLHYPLYSRSIWGYINEYGWLFHSIGGTLGYFYRTLGAKWVCYQPVVFTGIYGINVFKTVDQERSTTNKWVIPTINLTR
jgi:hypothetical protein